MSRNFSRDLNETVLSEPSYWIQHHIYSRLKDSNILVGDIIYNNKGEPAIILFAEGDCSKHEPNILVYYTVDYIENTGYNKW